MSKYLEFKPKELVIPSAIVVCPENERHLGFNLEEYISELRIKANEQFKGNKRAINTIFNGSREDLKMSQLFFNNYVNNHFPNKDFHIMNFKDMGTIFSFDPRWFNRHYADTTDVCLRTKSPNSRGNIAFVKELSKLVKQEGFNDFSSENPLVISGLDFSLDENEKNIYGLLPKLTQNTKIYYEPKLASSKNRIELEGVEKILWSREDGLSRVYANDDPNVNANNDNLRRSGGNGWVVAVNAGGVARSKLNAFYKKFEVEREKYKNSLKDLRNEINSEIGN